MQTVRALVHQIRNTLHYLSGGSGYAMQILSELDGMDLSAENQFGWAATEPPHDRDLRCAIDAIDHDLSGLADAMRIALPDLQWRVDHGIYYEPTADVGDGYRNGNMHCELVGPQGSTFHHDDFTLGLFLLKPQTLYRDHAHRAPELYLTLSEPTGWRFGEEAWRDMPAGTIVWNEPETSHATRVYDKPFLSIYSWIRDVSSKCRVVPRDDWAEIEQALSAVHLPSSVRKVCR